MKKNRLISALQYVDPALIEEAMEGHRKESHFRLGTLIAACLCLVCSITALWYMANVKTGPATDEPAVIVPTEETYETGAADTYSDMRIAFITDGLFLGVYSHIYETVVQFCEDNPGARLIYYSLQDTSTEGYIATTKQAVAEGYDVILFFQEDDEHDDMIARTVMETADMYPDVYYLVVGVGEESMSEDYVLPSNVCCITFQEEIVGFMAGVAAVRLGYTKLGFLGTKSIPRIVRYGYGFLQGAEYAAALTDTAVEVKYAYANREYSDEGLTDAMSEWYAEGTEVVFACGGSVNQSIMDAADQAGAKYIELEDFMWLDKLYEEGVMLTAVVEQIPEAIYTYLTNICTGNWGNGTNKFIRLGITSATNPEDNYIGFSEFAQFAEGFTYEDYIDLLEDLINGNILVSSETDDMPTIPHLTVDDRGELFLEQEPETEPEPTGGK